MLHSNGRCNVYHTHPHILMQFVICVLHGVMLFTTRRELNWTLDAWKFQLL